MHLCPTATILVLIFLQNNIKIVDMVYQFFGKTFKIFTIFMSGKYKYMNRQLNQKNKREKNTIFGK